MILTNRKKLITLSVLLAFVVVLIGTSIGSVYIPINKIMNIFFHKIFNTNLDNSITNGEIAIIFKIRFPRVLIGLLVGGMLSISGAAIQSVLNNPLASPYTLGVSSGATLGVALVIVFKVSFAMLGNFFLPMIGFLSSMVIVLSIIALSKKIDKNFTNQTIILIGVVSSLFVNGILTLLIAVSGDDMKSIIFWQMGSLSLKSYPVLITLLPFALIGFITLILFSKELDALTFGEQHAKSLGVETKKVRQLVIIISSLLTGSAVALTGVIGFIGLVAPHIVRKLFGSNHIILLPMSFIFGGVFLVLSDLVARTIVSPSELPVGAITALIGAPFFALIFFYKRR